MPTATTTTLSAQQIRDETYRYERLRSVAAGIIESATATFFLLIAVKVFDAGAFEKGLLASGNNFGLLLTPFAVNIVERLRWPAAKAAAVITVITGAFWLLPGVVPTHWVFNLAIFAGVLVFSTGISFVTQIYQSNYAQRERGTLFARANIIRTLVAAGFAEIAGRMLNIDLGWWRMLMFVFAGAVFFAAFCYHRIPSQPLANAGQRNPMHGMRYLRDDRRFLVLQISWFLLGFGTLMMMPLRVEYLANEKYGINLPPQQVAFYVTVIPSIVRLVFGPIWGWVFDRTSFFTMRMVLNFGFALSIAAFFADGSPLGLTVGAIVMGIANSGGDLIWSLWATKYTTPDKVADYMAVHTFITGIRGAIAPFAAFQLANVFELTTLGWVAAVMIVFSAFMLLPEVIGKKT